MARYDVVQQGRGPGQRGRELHLSAASPGEAVLRARRAMDLTGPPGPDHLYAVYRHRRVGGRKLVGVYGAPESGGTAGVREPRRPRDDPPSLRASRDLPR